MEGNLNTETQRENRKREEVGLIEENDLTEKIIGAAIKVHRTLGGPGLLEKVYEEAFCHALSLHSLNYGRQVMVLIYYKKMKIGHPLVVDLIIENRIIVEVQALAKRVSIFGAQLLTYLRLSKLKIGLLINFGEKLLKDGIKRVLNDQ